jgi:hypothetical protein
VPLVVLLCQAQDLPMTRHFFLEAALFPHGAGGGGGQAGKPGAVPVELAHAIRNRRDIANLDDEPVDAFANDFRAAAGVGHYRHTPTLHPFQSDNSEAFGLGEQESDMSGSHGCLYLWLREEAGEFDYAAQADLSSPPLQILPQRAITRQA